MITKELRIGNLIEVNPRENQVGLLSVQEIQKETIIGEMLSPKPGYHFRIKFDEIILIPLTEEWLKKAGFVQQNPGEVLWKNAKGLIDLHFELNGLKKFIYDGILIGKNIDTVNTLQNGYFFLTGEELSISP